MNPLHRIPRPYSPREDIAIGSVVRFDPRLPGHKPQGPYIVTRFAGTRDVTVCILTNAWGEEIVASDYCVLTLPREAM